MAGDGLRMGSGEPAEFPTNAKEVVAMFALETLRRLEHTNAPVCHLHRQRGRRRIIRELAAEP